MNAQHPTESAEHLKDIVGQLVQALERSERRHATLERSLRWGVLAFVAFVAAVFSAGFNLLGPAYAQQGLANGGDIVQALNNINRNLEIFGTMQGMMQGVLQSPDVQNSEQIKGYVKAIMQQNPGIDRQKAFQMAFAQAAGQVLVDTAILVKRLRQDSDVFRGRVKGVGGTNALLAGIEKELARLNVALASIPAMAGEMNVMNRQMSVMSYGVGSTMGRMGSIMPW
jgi:hypothetical protein